MSKCSSCRHYKPDWNSDGYVFECRKGKEDFLVIKNMDPTEADCDAFDSKYIEYPIEVSSISQPDGRGIYENSRTGDLVAVRPCVEQYENKTYLGILLGEADLGIHVSHNRETKELRLIRHYNPAMYVPALKKIIYGSGSWWHRIETEEDLKDITNQDIDGVWYVNLLKGIHTNKDSN